MEEAKKTSQETEKQSFGRKFVRFLMYGGFLLIILLAGVIFILLDKIFRG